MVTTASPPRREELRKSVARDAVVVSSNGLQASLVTRGPLDETRVLLASAMGERDAGAIKAHADHVLQAVLQRYERGLAEIVDARLAALFKMCRDGEYKGLADEIVQLRFALGYWGKGGQEDYDGLSRPEFERLMGTNATMWRLAP